MTATDAARPATRLPKPHFLQPSLLLLLTERPSYGYELMPRLKDFGIDEQSASVYRALRELEDAGAVTSYWNTPTAGPARRMYRLSSTGHDMLATAAKTIEDTHLALDRFFCRHALACDRRLEGAFSADAEGRRAVSAGR
jgi:PadR family transcriptional regulator PadR